MKYSLLAVIPALFYSTLVGATASEEKDHPLFSRYPGAEIRKQITLEYEPFSIPTSVINDSVKPYKYSAIDTKGNLTRQFYKINDVSTVKVYENYAAAAKKLGFNIVFSCQLEACGSEQQAEHIGVLISVENEVYNYYRKPYYLVAEKDSPKGKIVVAWFIGGYESEVAVQQVISEAVPLENNLIKVDPAYINKAATTTAAEKGDAQELAKDHKLLARYPNATLGRSEHVDSEKFSIPPAPTAVDKVPLDLTGDLSRHTYTIKDVSSLKIYENYKQALIKAGFNFLSTCELAECGTEDAAGKLGAKIAIAKDVYNFYHKPYYTVAKKASPSGDIYVALFIGAYESEVQVQQVILQVKGVETGLIKIDADALKSQIDAEGKALIYGIYFDTGKAVVKPESKPALDAIAQLLTKNKDLLLYVVGHTDDTGAGAANVDLSRQRATAVVNELVNTYKISAARLQAQGIGPYAPAANNTSEAGKQKNRRVELVRRLQ